MPTHVMYHVYCLQDPLDGRVKYVGCTAQRPSTRAKDLRKKARRGKTGNSRLGTWLADLWFDHGHRAIQHILAEVEPQRAETEENWWIDFMRRHDQPLLNAEHYNPGGLGHLKDPWKRRPWSGCLNHIPPAIRTECRNRTGYKGVTQEKRGRWTSVIEVGGKRQRLGTWRCAEEAALAYDEAVYAIWGPGAWLNFPLRRNGVSRVDPRTLQMLRNLRKAPISWTRYPATY